MNQFSLRFQKLSCVCAVACLALIAAFPGSALGSPGGLVGVSSNGVVGSSASVGGARATGSGARTVGNSSVNRASASTSVAGSGSVSTGVRSAGAIYSTAPVVGTSRSTDGVPNVGTTAYSRPSAPANRISLPANGLRPTTIPRRNNPWTDPAPTANTTPTTHFQLPSWSGPAYRQGNNTGNRNFTGTVLYPGAYGYRQNSPTGTPDRYHQHRNQDSFHQRGYNYPYDGFYRHAHRRSYYSYFAGDGYGGYFPYGGSFYDTVGLDNSLMSDEGGTIPADTETAAATDRPAAEPALPVPPPVGPQMFSSQPSTALGPDSLVEAVQTELTKLGYFGGKVDAIYGQDTRVALQRFQTDQALPATGRINAATLHALQLD